PSPRERSEPIAEAPSRRPPRGADPAEEDAYERSRESIDRDPREHWVAEDVALQKGREDHPVEGPRRERGIDPPPCAAAGAPAAYALLHHTAALVDPRLVEPARQVGTVHAAPQKTSQE